MKAKKLKYRKRTLEEKYPPSPPCACEICRSYCKRPGWWTVSEASRAIEAGYAGRMMLELSPERTFGVLSPAFRGNEGNFARQYYSDQGCTFLAQGFCELHGTGLQPLECRFCHHTREGLGMKCHLDIEREWNKTEGAALVNKWMMILAVKLF